MKTMNAQTVINDTLMGRDFYLSLGDFLDEFYRADTRDRKDMLFVTPDFDIPKTNLAYLASSVHKLANDHDIEPPEWVFDERCYLYDEPFFGCNATGNLRLLFMYKSPSEFKHRNLFVDENVLVRV